MLQYTDRYYIFKEDGKPFLNDKAEIYSFETLEEAEALKNMYIHKKLHIVSGNRFDVVFDSSCNRTCEEMKCQMCPLRNTIGLCELLSNSDFTVDGFLKMIADECKRIAPAKTNVKIITSEKELNDKIKEDKDFLKKYVGKKGGHINEI